MSSSSLCWAVTALVLSLGQAAAARKPVQVVVAKDLVREHFAGPGFHAEMFLDSATKDFFDQVLAKRWRDMNPGFARVMMGRNLAVGSPELENLARQLVFMKEATGTQIYLTGGLREAAEGPDRQAWARSIGDDLDYLLKAGATNLKFYCSTNELSLTGWGSLRRDLPTFRSYHQAIFDELRRRGLPVKLLATDASPIDNWNTIEWAAQNMDNITDVYGGHHYANNHLPDNLDFYDWFQSKCAWAAGIAKAKGKDFILGEFGPGQWAQNRYGVRWDTALFYDTPQEAQGGLQLAEAAVAAMNGGVYAMGYWTFTDYPERGGPRGVNHWGLFRWMTNGATTRAPYYAYSLLTKFFRGPAAVHQVRSGDPRVRAAAVQNEQSKAWSVAVINREPQAVPLSIALPDDSGKAFRKYVYDTAHVPVTEDGDLQESSGKLAIRKGRLADVIPAASLIVYTTAYDDDAPAPVRGLRIQSPREAQVNAPGDSRVLRWDANTETDLCYYRIYHGNVRVGSTTVTEFVDAGPTRNRPEDYSVIAVDQSGNASQPARVAQLSRNRPGTR
jgi:hypothetical protein